MDLRASDLIAAGVAADEIDIEPAPGTLRDTWPTGLKSDDRWMAPRPIVVSPGSVDTIRLLLPWAAGAGFRVRIQGGRSNVVGSLDGAADIVLSTARLISIEEPDTVSQTITAQAGVTGASLEAFLGERRLTLGHYPQSLATSTVGGWIATRAAGQASAAYGGVERLVCGIECVLPSGKLMRVPPRLRAPGFDGIAMVCGTEGTLAVVASATFVVARRLSERRMAATFADFASGLRAQRELVQTRIPVGVLRLLNAAESAAVAPTGSIPRGKCLLIASLDGDAGIARAAERRARETVRGLGGAIVGNEAADNWWQNRFANPGLIEDRNKAKGEMFDTIDVGIPWAAAGALAAAIEREVSPLVRDLWLHSSHVYPNGTCLYAAFWIKAGDDAEAVGRCGTVWDRTLQLVESHGGTFGHHHGIGAARSERYLETPEGQLHLILKTAIDPSGVLAARMLEGGSSSGD
jgi:alkyldihydroxyacetonephosphate synthase